MEAAENTDPLGQVLEFLGNSLDILGEDNTMENVKIEPMGRLDIFSEAVTVSSNLIDEVNTWIKTDESTFNVDEENYYSSPFSKIVNLFNVIWEAFTGMSIIER